MKHFNDNSKLTMEWVAIEENGTERFYKDHEVILINMFNVQFIFAPEGSQKKEQYRFVELPDMPNLVIDLQNKIEIDKTLLGRQEDIRKAVK